jgi:UDP-glucose 4-epimerase
MGPRREGDPPSLVADSQRRQNILGWYPKRAELDRIIADAWTLAEEVEKP